MRTAGWRTDARASDEHVDAGVPGKRTLTGMIQRKGGGTVGAGVEEQVARAGAAGGAALPAELQGRLEGATGAALGGVRVHTGAAAEEASATLGAQAWTLGTDLYFAEGAYAPGSAAGDHLIAHEVAHVVQQQRGADAAPRAKLVVGAAADGLEVEADRFADAFTAGTTAPIDGWSGGVVQREPGGEPVTIEARAAAADETGARKLARELVRDEVETPAEVARIGALVGDAARAAFWNEVGSRLGRALTGRIERRVPDRIETKAAAQAWIEPWAQLAAAWLAVLPADVRATVHAVVMERLDAIVGAFAKPNVDRFAKEEPRRDGVYAGVVPHLGGDAIEAAHHTAPATGTDPAEHEGERDVWMADETRRETARETAAAAEPFYDRAEVERTAAAMEHLADGLLGLDAATPLHPEMVQAYAYAVMAYKRALRLGSGSATPEDLTLLQDHAAVLDAHVVMLNRAETDRQADVIGSRVPGGRTQARGDVAHAGWWNPLMMPGLPVERRPQQMTLNEGRRASEITQVGLHEGGRTVGGTTKTFLDDPASDVNDAAESHFCVNPDGSVAQLAPVSERGAHIEKGNAASIGIDLTFYDGDWVGGTAAQDYMRFLERSPAQLVATAKLSLAAGDLSGSAFPLAPPVEDFDTKTPRNLNDSGPGIYPHGPARSNGHHDPGDEITQEFYKWVVVVQVWEEHFGPINVRDEGELARVEALVRAAERQALVALDDRALLATAGGAVRITTGTDQYTIAITPEGGTRTQQKLPRHTDRGALQLAIADGDVVTAGQPLARVNPYDDAQRGHFDAQVRARIVGLGT